MSLCWVTSIAASGFAAWAIGTGDYVFAGFMAVLAIGNAAAASIVGAAFRRFNW